MTTQIEHLAGAFAAALVDLSDAEADLARSLYDLLADGDPVGVQALARRTTLDAPAIQETLGRWPGVFRDPSGDVVGFWGLAIPEMAHRFHAHGGKPIHAWCALDPFLIVPVIGRAAQVESTDPVSGERITMTVTPDGIEDPQPSTAVVSLFVPDKPFDHDVIATFCHHVLNFASPRSAEHWASKREGIVLLPAAAAFEVGLEAWQKLRTSPTHEHH